MPVHIVPQKPQPSGQIKTCLRYTSLWLTADFQDSRLYTKLFLGSTLICCSGLYAKVNMEKTDCVWTLTIQTYPNSLSPLSWSDLNYWYKLLFYPCCQGNAWRSKWGSLQIWVVKWIMWQLQITAEIKNKTSQLLITCCLTFFPKPKEGGIWLWLSFKLPSSLKHVLSCLQGLPWNTDSLADKTFF